MATGKSRAREASGESGAPVRSSVTCHASAELGAQPAAGAAATEPLVNVVSAAPHAFGRLQKSYRDVSILRG
eukprot:3626406-Prymnesium_polylepis.2